MAGRKISISLVSGFDASGVKIASKSISDFDKKLAATNKWLMEINAELSKKIHNLATSLAVDYSTAADKSAKSLGNVYETLEQINARIDAPRNAAKAQEEMNRALQRYCELCAEAKRREEARLNSMRNRKSQWNQGPFAGVLYSPKDSDDNTSKAAKSATALGKAAKSAIPAMMALDRMIGGMDGSMGKVASGLKGIIGMLLAFGPAGAAVAGVMLAMETALNRYAEAQTKASNKIIEWADRVREKLAALRESHFDNMVRGIENSAKAVDRASETFERAAKRRENLVRKREALNAANAESELIDLRRQMADDVANANDANKSRVEAAWRLQIAEKEAQLNERAAKVAAESERESLETARKRLDLANSNLEKLSAAASKAQDEYNMIKELAVANKGKAIAEHDPEVERYKSAYNAAELRARAAATRVDDLRVVLEEAEAESEVNAANRANTVAKAHDAVNDAIHAYDKAESDYTTAQIEGERKVAAERERLDREEAMRRERMRQKDLADRIRDLRAVAAEEQRASADAQSLVAAATAKEQRAWGWYRDKGSLRAQLDEEKANAEAERQFEREFERLRSFHRDWRTAKNLSIDEEAVRRVGIAREEKSRAEEYAKATAESAQRAADALVAIQSAVAEGGGE